LAFKEWGGRGLAEQVSGLPINTRQVSGGEQAAECLELILVVPGAVQLFVEGKEGAAMIRLPCCSMAGGQSWRHAFL
jgi:hypothetical protein